MTLTLDISKSVESGLREMANREHRSIEETVCDILNRRLHLEEFHAACREIEPLARDAGFESEEDILQDAS